MKLNEIVPGLYLRGRLNQSWSMERKLRELREADIDIVVSLTPIGEPDLSGPAFYPNYYHVPLPDGPTFDRGQAQNLARFLAYKIAHDRKNVLVMCRAGRNRSGLIAALTLREMYGWSGAEALAYLRSRRPRAVEFSHGTHPFEEWLVGLPRKEAA